AARAPATAGAAGAARAGRRRRHTASRRDGRDRAGAVSADVRRSRSRLRVEALGDAADALDVVDVDVVLPGADARDLADHDRRALDEALRIQADVGRGHGAPGPALAGQHR